MNENNKKNGRKSESSGANSTIVTNGGVEHQPQMNIHPNMMGQLSGNYPYGAHNTFMSQAFNQPHANPYDGYTMMSMQGQPSVTGGNDGLVMHHQQPHSLGMTHQPGQTAHHHPLLMQSRTSFPDPGNAAMMNPDVMSEIYMGNYFGYAMNDESRRLNPVATTTNQQHQQPQQNENQNQHVSLQFTPTGPLNSMNLYSNFPPHQNAMMDGKDLNNNPPMFNNEGQQHDLFQFVPNYGRNEIYMNDNNKLVPSMNPVGNDSGDLKKTKNYQSSGNNTVSNNNNRSSTTSETNNDTSLSIPHQSMILNQLPIQLNHHQPPPHIPPHQFQQQPHIPQQQQNFKKPHRSTYKNNKDYNNNNNTNFSSHANNRHHNHPPPQSSSAATTTVFQQSFPGQRNTQNFHCGMEKGPNSNSPTIISETHEPNQNMDLVPEILRLEAQIRQNNPLADFQSLDIRSDGARFFMIRSRSEFNVLSALVKGVWCSTGKGNAKLNETFEERSGKGPVYLFYSLSNNCAAHFNAFGEMKSLVDPKRSSNEWETMNPSTKFTGLCDIKWLFVGDVPFSSMPNDEATLSKMRDTDPIPPATAQQILNVFKQVHEQPNMTSLFGRLEFYLTMKKKMANRHENDNNHANHGFRPKEYIRKQNRPNMRSKYRGPGEDTRSNVLLSDYVDFQKIKHDKRISHKYNSQMSEKNRKNTLESSEGEEKVNNELKDNDAINIVEERSTESLSDKQQSPDYVVVKESDIPSTCDKITNDDEEKSDDICDELMEGMDKIKV